MSVVQTFEDLLVISDGGSKLAGLALRNRHDARRTCASIVFKAMTSKAVGLVAVTAVCAFGGDSRAGAASTGVNLSIDALRTPSGPLLRFFATPPSSQDESTPAIGRMTITRPAGVSVGQPSTRTRLGRLVFDAGTQSGDHRTVTLRRVRGTASGTVLAERFGSQVILRPRYKQFLQVSLPSGARNPRVELTGAGARLLRVGSCRDLTFKAAFLGTTGHNDADSTSVSARRLRSAQLCR